MNKEERKHYMLEYNKMYRKVAKTPPAHIRRYCDCGSVAVHYISSAWVCDLCRRRDIVAKEIEAHNTALVSGETRKLKTTNIEYEIRRQRKADHKWAYAARQKKLENKLKQHAAEQHAVAISDFAAASSGRGGA